MVSTTAIHFEEVAHRLGVLRERLFAAGGDRVKVVAVTKGFGSEIVTAALMAGIVDIGENFAQELLAKAEDLKIGDPSVVGKPRWHFVGQLQRNKVRKIAGLVHLWQSVDRPELASEIARQAPAAKVLVQVDIVGVPGKGRGGCHLPDTAWLVEHCTEAGLEVVGLMGVGVPGSPEDARLGFRKLASLGVELGVLELSMGMSGDLEVAVSEGATMVRVGTALFGPRRVL